MRCPAPIALVFALSLLAAPGAAAEEDPFDLEALKRQLDTVWDELVDDVAPALERLEGLMETLERVDDLQNYAEPEFLPNGDIIIRRRPEAPDFAPEGMPRGRDGWQRPPEGPKRSAPPAPETSPGVRT
ncbi:MAG: hypothetical protein AAF074_18740 [Pseudomonadota bacterium]